MNHDEAVDKHYERAEEAADQGYWDAAFREISYYEEQVCPAGPKPDEKGLEVGEFDVLLVNYDDQLAFYKEIKTSYSHMLQARDQLERAQEFFEDTDWDVIGTRVLEK